MPDRPARPTTPDPGSFGGHPYTPTERALGYGTDHDPRFAQPTTQPADALEHRLDNAQARAAEAASEWCWNATPESEEALRNAVAEWRSALGLWRLARVSGQPAAAEGSATETTEPEGKYGDWRDDPGNYGE